MNAEADREITFGKFRDCFCECGKMNGVVHLNIWYDGVQLDPFSFSEALPAIICLMGLVVAGKLDKYKAMGLSQILLERLPLAEPSISAADAESRVIRECPAMELCIVTKIFAELKTAEAEYAQEGLGALLENGDAAELARAAG